MSKKCPTIGATAAGIAMTAIFASTPTQALNIVMNFNAADNEFTSVDPAASNLQTIMGFVEDFWEDHIQDTHTLTVNYWYEDISSLAKHDLVAQSGGRETEANVRFDTIKDGVERPWWFDPTPTDDSEFNMAQTLWRDLSPTQATDWYSDFAVSSEVPFTFETGYAGNVPGGSPLANQWDIVTSAIHEVGHALGLSGANTAAQAETGDKDYDFNPDFVFGATFSVETDNDPDQPGADNGLDIGHLENPNAGMSGGQAAMGRRRLPSHTDFFALASSSLWTNLDVPRREFYGNSNWNNASNWSGNKAPHANDDAFIRDALGSSTTITSRLTADGVVRNLTVAEGANFDTDSFTLDASQDVTVTDLNSDVFVSAGGTLEADEIFIQNSAEVEITDGSIIARRIVIDEGTQLEGVDPGDSFITISGSIVNNGQIDTSGGAVLVFSSLEDFPWDLDGDTDTGVVDASDGNISFAIGALADPFDGTMRVGATRTLTVAEAWTNSSGTIDLNGGVGEANAATLNGAIVGEVSMTGGLISATGFSQIEAPTTFFGGFFNPAVTLGADDTLEFLRETTIAGGTWTVGQNSIVRFEDDTTISGGTFNTPSSDPADGRFVFNGHTTYNGGTITVNGAARQRGNADVDNATTVNADVFDMDGIDSDTNVTWTLNDELTVNTDSIDSSGNHFDGQFTINHATAATPAKLTINLPGSDRWTVDTASNLIITGKTTSFASTIDGSDFILEGTAAITDLVAWDARALIRGAIIINADSNLRILGGSIAEPYVIEGAIVSGLGTLSTIGDRALVGHGSLATDVTFFNEAELRARDGELAVSGTINDVGIIGTADETGTLRVTNAWNTDVADLVELRGGSIIGAAITNHSLRTIRGHGNLAPNNLDNDGTIAANGGTLVVNPNNNLDLDGTGESGELFAVNGDLTVVNPLTDVFDGSITTGPSRTLTFESGWALGATGELNLNADASEPTAIAGTMQNLHGTTNVQRQAHFQIATTFEPTSTTDLNLPSASLHLFEPAAVEAGAAFTGDGRLVNTEDNTLTLRDGADVGVILVNDGTLETGSSPGAATVAAYNQGATGVYHAEIFTGPLGSHDELNVTGPASLQGTLDIDVIGALPEIGDEVVLMTYGARIGRFDAIAGTVLNTALSLAPVFSPAALTLRVTVPGDVNFDDIVSVSDLSTFALNFNTTPGPGSYDRGDFNGDGNVNVADLSLLALNFGFGTDASSAPTPLSLEAVAALAGIDPSALPEPGTASLLVLTLAVFGHRTVSAPPAITRKR